jgi:hypothetical protein
MQDAVMSRSTASEWVLLLVFATSACGPAVEDDATGGDDGSSSSGSDDESGSGSSASGSSASSGGSSASSTSPEPDPDPYDPGDCSNGPLTFGPADLPDAVVDEPYEIMLQHHADAQWGGWSYGVVSGEISPGLELSESESGPMLEGEPTIAGRYSFTIEAYNESDSDGCSTHPDPHFFSLQVWDADEDHSDS